MVQRCFALGCPSVPSRRSCFAFAASSAQQQRQAGSSTCKDVWGTPVWEQVAEPVAAYIHLPFCKKKCFYCDFPVIATGPPNRPVVQDRFTQYTSKLRQEIISQQRLNSQPLQTVFFGGGTPSLIPPQQLEGILETLHAHVGIASDAEISMEADPGTFDLARLQDYMRLGVTRFSVGVQSFNEGVLQECGRSHTVKDVHEAIAVMHAAAPQSWSLDLISGLPGVNVDVWKDSLQAAIDCGPPHISVYDLQVEESTPFGRWNDQGLLALPSEDSSVQQWMAASSMLRGAGFEHYELSNYSKAGHACKHNLIYWLGHSYYAFGLGASSYLKGARFSRPRKLKQWEAYVDALAGNTSTDEMQASTISVESSDSVDRLLDAVMLSLRLKRGLDLRWLHRSFGEQRARQVLLAMPMHIADGRAEIVGGGRAWSCDEAVDNLSCNSEEQLALRLTDPYGFLTSNDIISDVFLQIDKAADIMQVSR